MGDNQKCGLPNDDEQITTLLSMFGKDFMSNRAHWVSIGQCLKNLYDEDGRGRFEEITPDVFKSELDEFYDDLRTTRHGLPSLKLLAKESNPERYSEWSHKSVFSAALGSLKDTAGMTEIADIAKFLFGDMYVFTTDGWFEFEPNKHKWTKLIKGSKLQQKFSRELSTLYVEVYDNLNDMKDLPPEAKDLFKEMKERCKKIAKGLKEPPFKASLLEECSQVCFDDTFITNVDEDHMLLGLKNGVFDFSTMTHRRGFPEDFITHQASVSWKPGFYSWEHPDVKEVMLFFKKVLFHDELIDFSLKHKSTCCVGGNLDKFCMIYIGETAHNGKTTTQKLDKYTFGTYFGKLPLGAVVGKTLNSNEADPALAKTKGQRIVGIDEANQTQTFNFSFVKTATGNDEIFARPLYSQGFTFIPQFKLFMYLNIPPSAKTSDPAIWERLVLLPHDSRFVPNPPETEELQWEKRVFKADPFIDTKLKALAPAYFWILTQYWLKYKKEGLTKPDAVLQKSQKFKYENDLYAQYVDGRIEKTDRQIDFIPLTDCYINFKQWHTDAYPKSHTPDKQQFEKELSRLLGPLSPDSKWHGVKTKTTMQTFNRN